MSKFSSVPAYSLGAKRKLPEPGDLPGPGAYTVDAASVVISKKSSGVAIGHAPRDHMRVSDVPGPGAYSTPNIFTKPKGGYMGLRKPLHNSQDTPGPGAYADGNGSMRSGGYSFGKGKSGAQIADRSGSPGPGAYRYEDRYGAINKSSGYHLGKAARNILNQKDIPGPGAYSQESVLLHDKRGPVLGKAPRDVNLAASSATIGPGGYNVPREFDRHSSKGYRMGKAARQVLGKSDSPGPGQYDIDHAHHIVEHHPGVAVFPKSPRTKASKTEVPGPGAYSYADRDKRSNGYMSKRGREGLPSPDVPGPGAYNDVDAFQRLSSAKGGIKFGKSSALNPKADIPGPGAYKQDGLTRGGGIKFGKDPRDHASRDDKPGPGAYQISPTVVSGSNAKFSFPKAPRDKQAKDDTPFYYNVPHTIPDVAPYNYPPENKRKIHL